MCRSGTKRAAPLRAGSIAAALAALLAGCSDIYLDHRDTVGLSGGDAVAANEALQTVDPWPPGSGNSNITFNGQRMQAAIERYRNNRVIPPVNPTTSGLDAAPAEAAAPGAGPSGVPNVMAGTPATASTAVSQ